MVSVNRNIPTCPFICYTTSALRLLDRMDILLTDVKYRLIDRMETLLIDVTYRLLDRMDTLLEDVFLRRHVTRVE